MENDSTDTTSTGVTNTSFFSRTSQFLDRHKRTIKSFRRTVNLACIVAILYYVKTTNIAMDAIPPIIREVNQVLSSAQNLHNITYNTPIV